MLFWPILYDYNLDGVWKVFVFDEEFGDFASFEDEDSDDASEG